jgi:hypothetical protein
VNPRPILVGEANPYDPEGRRPEHALYCWPVNSSGWRLQSRIMGVSRSTYIGFDRIDLCGKWSAKAARERATAMWNAYPGGRFVFLGTKVCKAFMVEYQPFYTEDSRYVVLPHPSGLCRTWGEPGAYEKAKRTLRAAFPHIAWGVPTPEARHAPTCSNCGKAKQPGNICLDCGYDLGASGP